MAVRLRPDIEALTVGYLLNNADMTAVVGGRTSTEFPASPTFPLLVVTLITGGPVVAQQHDVDRVQIDAYGAAKGSASLAARTARAVMERMAGAHVFGTVAGVVTNVVTLVKPRWFPDPLSPEPRPRYLAEYLIYSHPS